MEPAIKTASLIVSMPSDIYNPGDIITFNTNSANDTTTHRIEFKNYENGLTNDPTFLTSGDANDDIDTGKVQKSDIIGKVILSVPYVGYFVEFAKTPQGFIFLIVVPATIVVYEETRFLFGTFTGLFRRKRKDNVIPQWQADSILTKRIKSPALFIFPFLSSLLVFSNFSISYFGDIEKSIGNVMSAASSFGEPPPTPETTKLVINEVYYDVDSTGLRSHGANTEDEGANEWIEIYNPNDFDVPFKDWQICDNTSCITITPNVDVPALGFALVSRDASTWTFWTIPPEAEKIHSLGGTPLGLSNTGDRLLLKNPENVDIDAMSWGSDTTYLNPSATDVDDGHSLERVPAGTDTDAASDFQDILPPTPGT
jgi:signal peptidase I